MDMFRYSIIILVVTCCITQVTVTASTLVRMEVQQGGNTPEILDIKLFDELAPITVTNFLKYINDGDYTNSFFHRTSISSSLSVIQGGGFTYDPLLNDGSFSYDLNSGLYLGGMQQVPTDPPIINEFSKSNTTGTLAMAKLGGDANSATSQWFVNMADNSSNLDNQNGGFTVFGEILGNGMSIINAMGAVPTIDKTSIHPAFSELPLPDYVSGSVNRDNLIIINTMSEKLSISATYDQSMSIIGASDEPEDVDFGIVILGNSVTANITLRNKGASTLDIGDIATTDGLTLPYSIMTNNCMSKSLASNESCDLSIDFTPSTTGVFDETINIEILSLNISYSLKIHGQSSIITNDIAILDSIEFGEILVFDITRTNIPGEITIKLLNQGVNDLVVQYFEVEGQFGYSGDCIVSSPIVPGSDCDVIVYFGPQSLGSKDGSLTIITDAGVKIITLTGVGSLDNDKVLTIIEDAAPNSGDGNNDGIQDSEQSNVLSFKTDSGSYITMLAGTSSVV